jgi:aminopeptidase N
VNDRPTDKATYDYRITVPAGKTAVANGDLTSSQTNKGWTTWRWRATDPMSSYLAMVSIGDYDIRRSAGPGGLPILTAVDRDLGPDATAGLGRTNEMISFFTRLLGPYPFSSFGGVIDDDDDAGYHLETQTRPIYAGVPTEADLAHELVHQWIGDSVGPQQWSDIWLNEGVTAYFEWLWQSHTGGPSPTNAFAESYAVPAADEFWSIAPGDPGPQNMFTDSVYTRGAMTMHALRTKIGDTAFFSLVRQWHTVHRGGNASTSDFIALAEQVSGKQLKPLFETWLYATGKPAATGNVLIASGHVKMAKPRRHQHRHHNH